jgi:hypothetical protein
VSAVVAVCNAVKKGQRHVLARAASQDGVPGLEVREAINPGKSVTFHWRFVALPDDEILGDGVTVACPCGRGKDFQVDVIELWQAYRDRRVIELTPWDKWVNPGL